MYNPTEDMKCGCCQGSGILPVTMTRNETVVYKTIKCHTCNGSGWIGQEQLAEKRLDAKCDRADNENDEQRIIDYDKVV